MIELQGEAEMIQFGQKLGSILKAGDVIELVGDVGAGKTTLVRGAAKSLNISDPIQSPSFTINRVYDARDGLIVYHYDFYRLSDAGIMTNELQEALERADTVVFIEWASAVEDVLPVDRVTIEIKPVTEQSRHVTLYENGERSASIKREVEETK